MALPLSPGSIFILLSFFNSSRDLSSSAVVLDVEVVSSFFFKVVLALHRNSSPSSVVGRRVSHRINLNEPRITPTDTTREAIAVSEISYFD